MVVLAIVAVACFIAGMWAATTWLPPLADGPVGTLVYFVVCGLSGAVLASVGIHVWQIVHRIEITPEHLHGILAGLSARAEIVANVLTGLLWESGSLAALALIAYLLAPKATKMSASN